MQHVRDLKKTMMKTLMYPMNGYAPSSFIFLLHHNQINDKRFNG